jgi:hypothetical protein
MFAALALPFCLCATSMAAPQDRPEAEGAFAILELMGGGSTMRQGPHKEPIKEAVKALRDGQEEAGWFVPAASPTRVLDQAVATLAMAEAWLGSNYTLLRKNTVKGMEALAAAVEAGPPCSTEVAAFGELLLVCLRNRRSVDVEVADAVRRLDAALRRRAPQPPSTPAEIAAEHLLRRLRAMPAPARFDASRLWSTAEADPLATFYLELADYRPEDPGWRTVSEERRKARESRRDAAESPKWHASLMALIEQLGQRSCRLLCVPE